MQARTERVGGAETALRPGQLASLTGVSVDTLRYYERRGLIAEPARTLGNQRLYQTAVVAQLRLIRHAQRLGFSLNEVAQLLDGRRRHPTDHQAERVRLGIRAKIAELNQRISELSAVRDGLQTALAAGCVYLDECLTDAGCAARLAGIAVEAQAAPPAP